MASWKWLLAAAALAIRPAMADSALIYPLANVSAWQFLFTMRLRINAIGPETWYPVVPLTDGVGLNQSPVYRQSINIPGNIVAATQSNYNNITGANNQIAYLCCDDLNDSFTDPDRMLDTLMANKPQAILLYSRQGNCCGLNSTGLAYTNILTMVNSRDATQAYNLTTSGNDLVNATIMGDFTNFGGGGGGKPPSNNSAIAMSILYSITGLITVLFLVIIAAGAIRAHRNPERYGPRSGHGGRPRQSRARGIARAVLETIPIVKFGDPTPPKPDPNIELESGSVTQVDRAAAADNTHNASSGLSATDVQVHHLSTIAEDTDAQPRSATLSAANAVPTPAAPVPEQNNTIGSAAAGAATAAPSTEASPDDDSRLGCSICTEDFNVGEDVRVLPCDHKFHPTCVDPWLINVSGTCPLCRLDLRPGSADASASEDTQISPPLEDDDAAAAAAGPATGHHRRRSSRLFELHRLRYATVEERIEVLRRFRTENQHGADRSTPAGAAAPGESEDEHSRSATLTKRLRDKFHIRTHAQSPNSSLRTGSRSNQPST